MELEARKQVNRHLAGFRVLLGHPVGIPDNLQRLPSAPRLDDALRGVHAGICNRVVLAYKKPLARGAKRPIELFVSHFYLPF